MFCWIVADMSVQRFAGLVCKGVLWSHLVVATFFGGSRMAQAQTQQPPIDDPGNGPNRPAEAQPAPILEPAAAPAPEPVPFGHLPAVGGGLSPVETRDYALPSEPEAQIDRRGLVVEVALGVGGLFEEEDGSFGLGYDIAVGGAVNRKLSALFNYSSLTIGLGDGQRATHAIFGGALQLFLGPRIWLKVGAGLGQLSVENNWGFTLDATERTLAGIVGVGIEVYQLSPNFALDLQLRAAGGSYEDAGTIINGAVMLGLNWY